MNLLKLEDSFLNIIHAGLMELQAKHAMPVINEINSQLKKAEEGAKDWLDEVKAHITSIEKASDKVIETVTDVPAS